MTVDELERELGLPADFIPETVEQYEMLCEWAALKGLARHPVTLSRVALTNLYHEHAGAAKPDDVQLMAARITHEVVMLLGKTGLDVEAVRAIVREMMPPVQRIEIAGPMQTVTLDGPLHYLTEKVIKIAAIGHPVMLVGPAGCGKTTIGQHAAKALALPFKITSTINDTHELIGFIDGYGNYHRTPFRDAFEKGGVWVADEIDAWDANALLAANAALANGIAVFPDSAEPIKRHPDFRMIATANTFGSGADRVYVGRNELDAASLDRFATLNIDYDISLEQSLSINNDWLKHVWQVRRKVTEKKIRHVVSTRAIIMGQAALASGIDWGDVCEIYLLKGLTKADRAKL